MIISIKKRQEWIKQESINVKCQWSICLSVTVTHRNWKGKKKFKSGKARITSQSQRIKRRNLKKQQRKFLFWCFFFTIFNHQPLMPCLLIPQQHHFLLLMFSPFPSNNSTQLSFPCRHILFFSPCFVFHVLTAFRSFFFEIGYRYHLERLTKPRYKIVFW